ncbi:MAG: HAD family hydrolase [Saccharofermentans sp.]|nr:HAD family hydrolase [Saccharofermentans sp.]
MIKAVVFDMYETLITLFNSRVYKGRQIAAEMNISEEEFRKIWDPSEDARTLGVITFEEVVAEILQKNGIFEKALYDSIIRNRYECSAEVFSHKHPDVVPMLEALKENGIKTGLITNCYLEEKDAIIKSDLYSLFDAVCMSCDVKMKKPDIKIFELCAEKLDVKTDECLYVGDGGSHELEAAHGAGMKPLQATWYLRSGVGQPCGRLDGFAHASAPMDVLKVVQGENNHS